MVGCSVPSQSVVVSVHPYIASLELMQAFATYGFSAFHVLGTPVEHILLSFYQRHILSLLNNISLL